MSFRQPLRRLLMTADGVGGVWTYALELCRELGERNVRVALATMGGRLRDCERAALRRLANVELFESDYKLEWMAEPWDDVRAAGRWLLDLESRTRPDLVHLNQYSHGALPWSAPCLVVGHSCVYSWFEAVKGAPPPPAWEPYRREVSTGLRAAGLVTAPSRAMLSALRVHYGSFAAGEPIYNGRTARRPPVKKKEPLILTTGRLWDEGKNATVLARAAGKLPWPVYAAGEGRSPDGGSADLEGMIPLGRLDSEALASWYGAASIFALPALYEPFGFTALEAALAGCALVLGDIPSLREIWRDAAAFVAPGDPEAIAATLAGLIENGPLRSELARRSRARALLFTPGRMACGYLSLYERLLSSRASCDLGAGSSEGSSAPE